MLGVPSYMPWRLFWAYFVGFALLSASLSTATRIQVRWFGLLFGSMMFLFVAMVHIARVAKSCLKWRKCCRAKYPARGGVILPEPSKVVRLLPGHFEGQNVIDSARVLGSGVELRVRLASGYFEEAVRLDPG